MNNFYTYILKCNDESYYVGHTDNIEKRVSEHRLSKYNCYTSHRLPIELVFVQSFKTRDEAFHAEHQIKNWSRQKKEALIAKDFAKIASLSKKKFNKK